MQAGGAEGSPSSEDAKAAIKAAEPQASTGSSVKKDDDEWGKFYSMPPKWKKDSSSSPSKSGLTDENIGHRLASLLRYHLDDTDGIATDFEGWVEAADIVAHAEEVGLDGCTTEDLMRVAENNEHSTRGKRFETDGVGRIKARYRHPPKDRRGDRWDRDGRRGDRWDRDGAHNGRSSRSRGSNGWQSSGWNEDNSKWKDNGWEENQGNDSWTQWKKPGFSPSPDDAIVNESTWVDTAEKPTQPEPAVKASQAESVKVACSWEQWFTPDTMEMYLYNTKTEEVFYPGDIADAETKGWFRYVDTEGEKEGKIYWWHEPSNESFYEDDTAGDVEEEA